MQQVNVNQIVEKTKNDTLRLIRAVRNHPSIWDKSKTLRGYENKIIRQLAWDGVLEEITEGYHSMSPSERDDARRRVMVRWRSIKNCHMVRRRSRKSKYIYSPYLTFLNCNSTVTSPVSPVAGKSTDAEKGVGESHDNLSRIQITCQGKKIIVNSDSVIEHDIILDDDHFEDTLDEWELDVNKVVDKHTREDDSISKDSSVPLESINTEARPKKRVYETSGEEHTTVQHNRQTEEKKVATESNWGRDGVEILASILEREEDDDKSFFNSLIPLVKSLSENSKMEFRIEAWKLLKEIADQNEERM